MPVENVAGTIVITGNSIYIARLLSMVKGLELEIKGIKVSRNSTCYAMLKRELGITGSRAKVLATAKSILADRMATDKASS